MMPYSDISLMKYGSNTSSEGAWMLGVGWLLHVESSSAAASVFNPKKTKKKIENLRSRWTWIIHTLSTVNDSNGGENSPLTTRSRFFLMCENHISNHPLSCYHVM